MTIFEFSVLGGRNHHFKCAVPRNIGHYGLDIFQVKGIVITCFFINQGVKGRSLLVAMLDFRHRVIGAAIGIIDFDSIAFLPINVILRVQVGLGIIPTFCFCALFLFFLFVITLTLNE